MDSNPIKYSDLIHNDGAIDDAIRDLNALVSTFKEAVAVIKQLATEVQTGMRTASGATEENRKAIRKTVDETSRLERAQQELMFAMSAVGTQIADLKRQTAAKNTESKLEGAFIRSNKESYNELNAQLKLLIGQYKGMTKEQALNSSEGQKLLNIILELKSQILVYTNAMTLEKKATKENTAAKKEERAAISDVEKAKQKLAYASSAENAQLLLLANQTREANQVSKLNAIIATEAEGSYNRLSAQYALNKIELNKMSAAQRDNSVSGKKLVSDTNAIYNEMIKLQEATGKHSLSVGNYRKAWDGLGMSVNQIMREVPAAGISLNTFFLAISNNVPILVDEIQMVSAANKVAAAEGKATVNIWKSVLGAVFSWQSMLVIIITVLSMYGKQIFQWIGDLFKATKALNDISAAARNFNAAMLEGKQDAQQELTRLKLLYSATTDVTRSLDYRKKAVTEIRKQYPAYFKNMTDEQILAGAAADEYLRLAGAILKVAMSRAAEDKMVENSKEILKLDEQIAKQKSLVYSKQVAYDKAVAITAADRLRTAKDPTFAQSVIEDARVEEVRLAALKESQLELTNLTNKTDALTAANNRLAKNVDIVGNLKVDKVKKDKDPKDPKDPKDRTEQIERENLAIAKKYAEAKTQLEYDEIQKRKLELTDAYNTETAALMNKYNNDKDLTEQSKTDILATTTLMYVQLQNDLRNADLDYQERSLAIQAETIQLRLEATKEGSVEENNVRLELLEINRQQEILTNSRLIAAQRQSEKDINAKWDNIILKQSQEFELRYQMDMFNISQDIEKAEFEQTRKTEQEKTRFKLEQERARWKKILEIAEKYAGLYSDKEIANMKAMINSLTGQMNEVGSKGFDFYSMMGFTPSDEYKSAMQEVFNQTLDNIRNIIDAQVQASEIAVDKAQKRVDAAKNVVQQEIEARNAGYASSVAQAQKDLDLERKTLDKAQKEKAKAVKAQQALDTIMQTSSMITATAQIFSSLSGIPIVGWALAIAAVAAMWGTFAVSKVKAAQISKQSYGEGGYEFLDGGSHQSGNDIPIGETSDGKQRRAEGGETLAIIRKTQTRKYRRILPDIINSLNKGIFEQKYMKSYDSGNIAFNVQSNTNLKELENDVRSIKEQGERKHIVDGSGNMVEYYKNLKRVYR